MINAVLACLDYLCFLSFWLDLTAGYTESRLVAPLHSQLLGSSEKAHTPFCLSCVFLREVESAFYRLGRTALCSFSSAAHLVGYYVKEMESIAEQWVMLFTGKNDDQRQGITPSRTDVSWKIPLFHREEGKVQRTLEMVGMTTGTFVRKGRRVRLVSEQSYSPNWGHRDSKECQLCKKQGHTCAVFTTWVPWTCEESKKIWILRCKKCP